MAYKNKTVMEYNKEYYEKNKERERERGRQYYAENLKGKKNTYYHSVRKWKDIEKQYGLTKEQYEEKIASQPTCPICNEPFTEDDGPYIDHNHETGRVRSLLHRFCNLKVGQIEKDIQITQNVLKYLKDHTQEQSWQHQSSLKKTSEYF